MKSPRNLLYHRVLAVNNNEEDGNGLAIRCAAQGVYFTTTHRTLEGVLRG